MDGILHEDLCAIKNDIIPFVKECIGKRKDIPPESLFQIQQITNISVPTYEKSSCNNDEKYTLKVAVTDGHNQAFALVPDGVPGLSVKTPPGTKIRITQPVPVVQGKLLVLSKSNCEVHGGKVPALIDKWEQQKKMAVKHEWGYAGIVSNVTGDGPPTWKPFGSTSTVDLKAMRKLKTTDVAVAGDKKGNSNKEKTRFDVQREEAIQEGGTGNKNKRFQKPNKHLLPKEITDIMNQGFSQAEAESAMRQWKSYHKALKFLKESKSHQEGTTVTTSNNPFEQERKFHQRKGRKGMNNEEDENYQDVPAEFKRPTNDVSLFGFIKEKIKTGGDEDKLANTLETPGNAEIGLEKEVERLALVPETGSSRGWHHEVSGGRNASRRGGGRNWRHGGGDVARGTYSHPPQQRYYEFPENARGRDSNQRFQNRRSRGAHYHHDSMRNHPTNFYQAQEQRNYGTPSWNVPQISNETLDIDPRIPVPSSGPRPFNEHFRSDLRILSTSYGRSDSYSFGPPQSNFFQPPLPDEYFPGFLPPPPAVNYNLYSQFQQPPSPQMSCDPQPYSQHLFHQDYNAGHSEYLNGGGVQLLSSSNTAMSFSSTGVYAQNELPISSCVQQYPLAFEYENMNPVQPVEFAGFQLDVANGGGIENDHPMPFPSFVTTSHPLSVDHRYQSLY